MDFNKLFAPDSALTKIASSYVSGLANAGSKPKPLVVQVESPSATSMPAPVDYKKWAMIGIGSLAGLFLVLKLVKGK